MQADCEAVLGRFARSQESFWAEGLLVVFMPRRHWSEHNKTSVQDEPGCTFIPSKDLAALRQVNWKKNSIALQRRKAAGIHERPAGQPPLLRTDVLCRPSTENVGGIRLLHRPRLDMMT